MKTPAIYIVIFLSAIIFASCGTQNTSTETSEDSGNTNLETNNENMVQTGSKVAVHYTGTLTDGTKFDSSLDRGTPLEFTAGTGQMIPGFDAGVMGMQVGDKKTLTLAPAEAYGEYDESRTETVTRENLASFEAAGFKLEVGEKIPTQFGTLKITSVDGDNITLDLNHELAGETLIFDIELVEIKK
jgi:FKBP-type peptidyl-prolyl cis-trans isomerase 2